MRPATIGEELCQMGISDSSDPTAILTLANFAKTVLPDRVAERSWGQELGIRGRGEEAVIAGGSFASRHKGAGVSSRFVAGTTLGFMLPTQAVDADHPLSRQEACGVTYLT